MLAEATHSVHRFLHRFRQNATLLTDPIDNSFAIHRLLSVVVTSCFGLAIFSGMASLSAL